MQPNRERSCALVAFVKTPEYSPVKTRLSAGIGSDAAIQFFNLATEVITHTMSMVSVKNTTVHPFWAVAEVEALESPRWHAFSKISQGVGSLGDRLHRVYHEIKKNYDSVILIGADSPQLTAHQLEAAIEQLNSPATIETQAAVLGPALDGGFYLFGSCNDFPESFWTAINYSASTTCAEVIRAATEFGVVHMLSDELDVDTAEDLVALALTLSKRSTLSEAERTLYNWILSLKLAHVNCSSLYEK